MNLFAYGTLMNKTILKAVCGKTFTSQEGNIKNFKKFSPRSGYPYIVQKEEHQVEGILYSGIDRDSMTKIDQYESEGTLYNREKIKVFTKKGIVEAYTYIGNLHNLRRVFGEHIDVGMLARIEEYIEKRIGERIEIIYNYSTATNPSEKNIESLSKKELLGAEIKEVINMFFNEEYVSNYVIDSELKFKGIPTLPLNEEIPPKIYSNYVDFIFHTMILNQLEEHISKNLNELVYYSYPLYEKTLSLLTALRFFNSRLFDLLIYREDFFKGKDLKSLQYLDIAKMAVVVGKELYFSHPEEIRLIATEIRRNLNPGLLSIGLEMEFSNLGYQTLKPKVPLEQDKVYHGFRYFNHFDMHRLLWKLGGHLDDHKTSIQKEKIGGFLEFAVGRESIYNKSNSSPLTKSLYLSNAFLSEMIMFTNIKPHSLHINIQGNYDINWKKENNPELLKCLILLGGDFRKTKNGKIVERRIYNRELIKNKEGVIRFICENKRWSYNRKEYPIIEYQFPRLSMMKDYESMVGAFKGFQTAYQPRPFISKVQLVKNPMFKKESEVLEKWANNITPVSKTTVENFLSYVEKGLFTENNGQPAHKKKYIENVLFKIEKDLKSANESISDPRKFIRRNQDIPYAKLARKFLVS